MKSPRVPGYDCSLEEFGARVYGVVPSSLHGPEYQERKLRRMREDTLARGVSPLGGHGRCTKWVVVVCVSAPKGSKHDLC